MKDQIESVLTHFPIGAIEEVHPIPTGLINKSYAVHSTKGNYILQKMGIIFDNNTIEDMALVTAHLSRKDIATPMLIKTNEDVFYHTDASNGLWRVMTAMDGVTVDVLSNEIHAQEAGRVLATFHSGMEDFAARQLKGKIKLHQTKNVYDDFCNIYDKLLEQETNPIMREGYTYIKETLPTTFLPDGLPTTVIHGDPKISNIIFNQDKAVCMIDLDTCIEHSPLVDIGEALGSWCAKKEDDPHNHFSIPLFESAVRGYMDVIPLSRDEQQYLYRAIRMIRLELASRFAKDIIDNSYFGWDKNNYDSRRAHNTARVLSMVRLTQDIVSKKDKIIDILNNI